MHTHIYIYRRRELRFRCSSEQESDGEEEETGALTAAAAALAASREGMEEEVGTEEDLLGSPSLPSGMGFELRLSRSPDEDVEVL